MKITYKEVDHSHTAVFLEGKRIGTITKSLTDPVHPIWQYFPYGEMEEGGEKFSSLALCKQSLEGE